MARIERFRWAEEDLLAIAEYIARDNPDAASRWLDEIEEKLTLLAKQPFIGEAVDHIRPGLRRSSHGRYLIFYELRENGIVLVRVLDERARLKTCFKVS